VGIPKSFKIALLALLLMAVANLTFGQNTKGDKPARALPKQIQKSKPKKEKVVKSNTRDISGRRLRTKNKSSAVPAIEQPPATYYGKKRKGDKPGRPVSPRRIQSSTARAARNNVYPNSGPYVNNNSRKPRSGERSFSKAPYRNATPQVVSRSESFDEAFSGEAMLPALTKMRAAVDRRAQDASGKKDPSAGKLLNIISQLYLEALAEGSARKSEMRRRGVAGEVDMLQSFTQQGRADANFLASVEYEPKIQDALQQMRNQSRTGDRERKSEIFDELTQRYAGTLDPQPSPFINALTNMASKFFLATSPGYYLQNLTQPFMMSLPAMAGRHDYTKAAAEMAKAYTELGPLFKDEIGRAHV
jgi:hypothetical protein